MWAGRAGTVLPALVTFVCRRAGRQGGPCGPRPKIAAAPGARAGGPGHNNRPALPLAYRRLLLRPPPPALAQTLGILQFHFPLTHTQVYSGGSTAACNVFALVCTMCCGDAGAPLLCKAVFDATHAFAARIAASHPLPAVCNGALPAQSANSQAWPASCTGMLVSSVCTATCATGYTESAHTACGSNGQWSAVRGGCAQAGLIGAHAAINNLQPGCTCGRQKLRRWRVQLE